MATGRRGASIPLVAAIGTIRDVGDRTALLSIGALTTGLGTEAGGLLPESPAVTTAGRLATRLGAVLYAGVVLAIFWERHWRDTFRT